MAQSNAIDRVLSAAALALLERLEAALPPGIAAMFWFYNRAGRDLDLVVAASNNHDPGDSAKVLAAALSQTVRQAAGRSRRYVRPAGSDPSSSVHVVSSAEVTEIGAHELVRVWSRGGLAGELIVSRGDGARLCCVMLMLEPEADDRA